jgi:hypothetical protein
MSEEQYDETEETYYEEVNISEVLQMVLSMQAELGIMSDILADVLKTGQFNKEDMLKALHSINELSLEAIEVIAEVEGDEEEEETFNSKPSPEDLN